MIVARCDVDDDIVRTLALADGALTVRAVHGALGPGAPGLATVRRRLRALSMVPAPRRWVDDAGVAPGTSAPTYRATAAGRRRVEAEVGRAEPSGWCVWERSGGVWHSVPAGAVTTGDWAPILCARATAEGICGPGPGVERDPTCPACRALAFKSRSNLSDA